MTLLSGLDALFVSDSVNIRYCTGFHGASPGEREAFLLILADKAFLFVNSLYAERAKDRQWLHGYMVLWLKDRTTFQTRTFSREVPFTTLLRKLCVHESIKRLGYEEANLTVAEFGKLKKSLSDLHLVPTNNRVESLRMIKRDDELALIRRAAKLTDRCFDALLGRLKPGVTETELTWEIESFFRKAGASSAFSPIVAFGRNTSQPHYQGTRDKGQVSRLKKNDIALLDFGALVGGYCADMTRVVFIGKPGSEWKRAYQTVRTAQMQALEYLNSIPNPSGAQADRIARKVIRNEGFSPYPHSLGHAVGLEIHEAPRLTRKKDVMLKPNMVVTVEPGIYIGGSYGIRIEDLVCLKKQGIDVLSHSSKTITIL